jgi:ribosomal subunit interface protein
MIFILTARHFKAHDSLKQFAESEAQKLTKYFDGITRVEVILSYDKPVSSIKTAEVIMHAKPHHDFKAKDSTNDFKLSIESAFNKVATQLKKYVDKLTDHHIAAKAADYMRNRTNNHTDYEEEQLNTEQTDQLHTEPHKEQTNQAK